MTRKHEGDVLNGDGRVLNQGLWEALEGDRWELKSDGKGFKVGGESLQGDGEAIKSNTLKG